MKILKSNAGHLTNFEVLDLLRSRGASKDPTRVMSLITSSEFKVYDYLVESAACDQTRENINQFVEKSKEYKLAKAEVINIINIRPSSEVELAPLIELEQRGWDEEKLTEIVEMVTQVLPPHPNQKESDEVAAEDDSAKAGDEDNAEDNAEEEMDAS
ncbi:DNA-directed RNA polymerase III subunit RPC9 [Bienertia sinuspersici]